MLISILVLNFIGVVVATYVLWARKKDPLSSFGISVGGITDEKLVDSYKNSEIRVISLATNGKTPDEVKNLQHVREWDREWDRERPNKRFYPERNLIDDDRAGSNDVLREPFRRAMEWLGVDGVIGTPLKHQLFVHCNQGRNRSAAFAVSLLMIRHGLTLSQAVDCVRQSRFVRCGVPTNITLNNKHFLHLLGLMEARLRNCDSDEVRVRLDAALPLTALERIERGLAPTDTPTDTPKWRPKWRSQITPLS